MKYFLIFVGLFTSVCRNEAQHSRPDPLCQSDRDTYKSLFAVFPANIESNAKFISASAQHYQPFSKDDALTLSINAVLHSLDICFGLPAHQFKLRSLEFNGTIGVILVTLEQNFGDWRVIGGSLTMLFGYNEELLQYHGNPLRSYTNALPAGDSLLRFGTVVKLIIEYANIHFISELGNYDSSVWSREVVWVRPDVIELGSSSALLAYIVSGSFDILGPFQCYGTQKSLFAIIF
jgi:hypothetical protein